VRPPLFGSRRRLAAPIAQRLLASCLLLCAGCGLALGDATAAILAVMVARPRRAGLAEKEQDRDRGQDGLR
jgi:hypothetical protein